jgi:hypothetical protein
LCQSLVQQNLNKANTLMDDSNLPFTMLILVVTGQGIFLQFYL